MLRCIKTAAQIIKDGGLVAFPTETVYGLGADAFNPDAVGSVYAAKGRPKDNPLIVHVASPDGFRELCADIPAYAEALVGKFWPGPLTLVAKKKSGLPAWLGGHPGGSCETVAVRMPSHPIALELIKESGRHISAPSANRSGRPSPTFHAHVAEDFPAAEAMGIAIFEGGHSSVGLESTVVDATGGRPAVLRPGMVTEEEILAATGLACESLPPGAGSGKSPGTMHRHYAPKAPLTLLVGDTASVAEYLSEAVADGTGALISQAVFEKLSVKARALGRIIVAPSESAAFARNLYSNLRAFDSLPVDAIFAEPKPGGMGLAIMDRLHRAAEGRVLIV